MRNYLEYIKNLEEFKNSNWPLTGGKVMHADTLLCLPWKCVKNSSACGGSLPSSIIHTPPCLAIPSVTGQACSSILCGLFSLPRKHSVFSPHLDLIIVETVYGHFFTLKRDSLTTYKYKMYIIQILFQKQKTKQNTQILFHLAFLQYFTQVHSLWILPKL